MNILVVASLVFAFVLGCLTPMTPAPLPSSTPIIKKYYVDHPVRSTFIDSICPTNAIGAITQSGGNLSEMTGSLVNMQSSERNGFLTIRFWRPSPRAESVIVMNLRTNVAYATVGSVRKIKASWCAFSRQF